jgi:hypothetical protein
VGAVAFAVYWHWLRPRHLRWGPTEAEARGTLPGDELLPYTPTPMNTFFYRVILEPGSFIAERKMLLGIKERAEGAARQQGWDGVAPGGMS